MPEFIGKSLHNQFLKGLFMQLVETIEMYLFETGQIHALAKRQARMLSRYVHDVNLVESARLLLLLNLAALNKGAPRAPSDFLLKPCTPEMVEHYLEAFLAEHDGQRPLWEQPLLNCQCMQFLDTLVAGLVKNPHLLKPLSGEEPSDQNLTSDATTYPLLVVNSTTGLMGFSRYWEAASSLEQSLRSRLRTDSTSIPPNEKIIEWCTSVFITHSILPQGALFHYRQLTSAILAISKQFFIVSGGPGTGKTRVVAQILRILIRAYPALEPDQIMVCAPTGRAKSRLAESIGESLAYLKGLDPRAQCIEGELDASLQQIHFSTVHALLGIRPDGTSRYTAVNPLRCQLLIVDEASMVPLHIFADLLKALPLECRIILVGDMHQLPSVEAGTVLGDLTRGFNELDGYPTLTQPCASALAATIAHVPCSGNPQSENKTLTLSDSQAKGDSAALADHVIILNQSFRSVRDIVAVGESINRGESERALEMIASSGSSISLNENTGIEPIEQWIVSHSSASIIKVMQKLKNSTSNAGDTQDPLTGSADFDELFAWLDGSRILVLVHNGPRGRITINQCADRLLRKQFDLGSRTKFFHGQQVILTKNYYDLELYNGDIGIVLSDKNGSQKVVFRRGKQFVVHAINLLEHMESAFAMTVHKSQGSEFNEVQLVLPEYKLPLLTRQILYTGLTRAKNSIQILGTKAIFRVAVQTHDYRPGGVTIHTHIRMPAS